MKNYTREQAIEVLKYLENIKKCVELTNKSLEFRSRILDLGLDYLRSTGFADRADRLKMHYLTEQKFREKGITHIKDRYVMNPEKIELFVEYQELLHPNISEYFKKFSEQKVLLDAIIVGHINEKIFQDVLVYISKNNINIPEANKLSEQVREEITQSLISQGIDAKLLLDSKAPLKTHMFIRAIAATHFLKNYSLFNIDDTFEVSNYHPKKYICTDGLENLLDKEKYVPDEKYSGIRQTVKLKNDKNGKVKSILKIEDRGMFLKYMTFGLFGNKKDIVLGIDPDNEHKILHIEKDDLQIKNYSDGENKLFIEDQVQHPSLVQGELSKFNDVELFYKNGRLNLAAIGGEGLLYTTEFIMKNYDNILRIGKK